MPNLFQIHRKLLLCVRNRETLNTGTHTEGHISFYIGLHKMCLIFHLTAHSSRDVYGNGSQRDLMRLP